MQPVRVENLVKQYGALRALDGVSLAVEAGELFFLLGPSGCGKTTLLRAIAGFVPPDAGRIEIGGRDATRMPPQARNTGMVFQSYALWPHLTVRENVAFGLRLQALPRAERDARVDEALAVVRIADQAEKKPNQLSGGQQQRVALARALVIRPACLLLDEPLSNLDAKLRAEMRGEIRRICKASGLTAIYVTHDQKEALAIADRIAVMRAGQIEQLGPPRRLYHHPVNRFVADFLGHTNFLRGRVTGAAAGDRVVVATPVGPLHARADGAPPAGEVLLGIRPEALSRRHAAEVNVFEARVTAVSYLGEVTQYDLATEGGEPRALAALELNAGEEVLAEGARVRWHVAPEHVMLLPAED